MSEESKMLRQLKVLDAFETAMHRLMEYDMQVAASAAGCGQSASFAKLSYRKKRLAGMNGLGIACDMARDMRNADKGFAKLCQAGRFDATVEALVLDPAYSCIMPDDVIQAAAAKKAAALGE